MIQIAWEDVMTFVRFAPHLGTDWLEEEPQGNMPDNGYLYRRFQCNDLVDVEGVHINLTKISIVNVNALLDLRRRYNNVVNDTFLYGDDDEDCEAVHDRFGPQYIFLDLLCDIVDALI